MKRRQADSLTIKESYKRAGLSGKTALILSTWFGTGLIPLAPGTFGSLAAIPFFIFFNYLGVAFTGLFLIIFIPLAFWASGRSEKLLGRDDPSEVVIDEVIGFFFAVFFIPVSWVGIIIGFALFRFFDILKPFPIGTIDKRVKGGIGIVLDDILAGIYANICLRLILMLIK